MTDFPEQPPEQAPEQSPEQRRPKPFRVETTVAAPAERVWAALTEPELVRQWFGWDYPGLDDEIRAIFVDGVVPDGHRLAFTDDESYLEISPDGPRTVIRAVLPGSLADAGWEDLYDGVEEGWRAFFEQLRFLLEARPAGRRRTVFLTGEGTAEQAFAVLGDARPWHASRYLRAAVEPDGYLLGVDANRTVDGGGSGPVSLTVTTYGLDDETFRKVRDDWAARWVTAVAAPKATSQDGEEALAG
jgi:uncharacterized protein YndB with AHSA1/START domain